MNYFIYFTSFFALLQPLFFFWRIAQPTPSPSYTFYSTGETHFITSHITFNTKNVIYMVQCNRCHICCRPDWLGFRDFASPFSICSYERVGWLGSWDLGNQAGWKFCHMNALARLPGWQDEFWRSDSDGIVLHCLLYFSHYKMGTSRSPGALSI